MVTDLPEDHEDQELATNGLCAFEVLRQWTVNSFKYLPQQMPNTEHNTFKSQIDFYFLIVLCFIFS